MIIIQKIRGRKRDDISVGHFLSKHRWKIVSLRMRKKNPMRYQLTAQNNCVPQDISLNRPKYLLDTSRIDVRTFDLYLHWSWKYWLNTARESLLNSWSVVNILFVRVLPCCKIHELRHTNVMQRPISLLKCYNFP